MPPLDAGSLGALLGTFITHIVQGDSMAKEACMERDIAAFNAGNFDLKSELGVIGMDDKLEVSMSVPKAMVLPLQPILITQAELDINMSVSSSESSSTDIDSQTEVQGSASIGFGFWKASMSVKSSLGVKSSNRRSTDQRSTCEAKVIMGQGDAPEGISRILDGLLIMIDKGMDINLAIVERKAKALNDKALGDSDDQKDESDEPTSIFEANQGSEEN